jgi:small subunit ribosomal protein S17
MTGGKIKMDIGIDVTPPKEECDDSNCPFHGGLKVRGQIIDGRVVSDKAHQTVVVEKEYTRYNKKFERSERRMSRYSVHNPKCINAAVDDTVKIMECKPISKTKSFVVVEASR